MQAGDLRNKIELYHLEKSQNELAQDIFAPVLYKKVWACIQPANGTQESLPGDVKGTRVTHRIWIRRGTELKNDMVIKYRGQKYRVKYWQPVYNNEAFTEILAEMEQNV